MSGAGAGAAAAAAAAIANAIKASGAIVQLEPDEFGRLLNQNAQGLVVHAPGSFFSPGHRYLMGYKGFVFFTPTREAIQLPGACQLVEARKIWVPG